MTNTNDTNGGLTRRDVLVAGVGGAATLGAVASSAPGGTMTSSTKRARMPVVFLPHGGGPWPFVDVPFGDKAELDALARYLRELPSTVLAGVSPGPEALGGDRRHGPQARPGNMTAPQKPKALLVVSAHWEERVPTVMTSPHPPMLYDYYGFPPESYAITWPAPGEPQLAQRVRALLEDAGFETGVDDARGYDHGTFVPLKLAFPAADIPVVQLSLKAGLDPAEHIAIGKALAPLRDEGVLIVGSGMSFHNLRAFRRESAPVAEAFDEWLRDAATLDDADARNARLVLWAQAPSARAAHPREEHLLPLMVAAGAAGADKGRVAYNGTLVGLRFSAVHFG